MAVREAREPQDRKPWTTSEDAILREFYPKSVMLCAQMIPHRTYPSMRMRANRIGIKGGRSGASVARRTYDSVFVDARIREAWNPEHPFSQKQRRELAEKIGVSYPYLYRRAQIMGLVKNNKVGRPWDAREDELVESFGAFSPKTIAANLKRFGYERTASAVSNRLHVLNVKREDARHHSGLYSASMVAHGLGVVRTTVGGWIRNKGLKARMRPDGEAGGYDIQPKDLAEWLCTNWPQLNLAKANPEWLMQEVFGRALKVC